MDVSVAGADPLRFVLSDLVADAAAAAFSEGAFFAPGSQPRVDVAITAVGSLDDLHHGDAWDRIAADRTLVARYKALKREHEGVSVDAYLAAKPAFFYSSFEL